MYSLSVLIVLINHEFISSVSLIGQLLGLWANKREMIIEQVYSLLFSCLVIQYGLFSFPYVSQSLIILLN